MKPIRHTKTARLRGLKMYREDLDELVKLFEKCASVTISDNKNNYESLDEMKQTIGPKIVNLDIRGERPGLHFLLNQREYPPGATAPNIFNELRTEELTDSADDLFREVKEFLVEHQRPSSLLLVMPALTVLLALCVFMLYGVANSLRGNPIHAGWGLFIAAALIILCLLLGLLASRNLLRLETRRNSASFFVRNWEEFAKHTVTAVISGGLGLFFGWLLGRFGK